MDETAFEERIVAAPSRQEERLERLRSGPRPVVLYGAGVYAYVLRRYLAAKEVPVERAVVDAAYRGADEFLDLPLSDLEGLGDLARYDLVVATANHPRARSHLEELGAAHVHVVDVPDFLNIPERFMDREFVRRHAQELASAYSLLEDELSRDTFVASINAKLSDDVAWLEPVVRPDHLYFATSEIPLGEQEALLDVGGYDGDSVREFHDITGGRYQSIVSLEPFPPSFRQLSAVAESLDPERVLPVPLGAWHERATLHLTTEAERIDNKVSDGGAQAIEVDTIDAILDRVDRPVTFIKMDINGAESHALRGAARTIRDQRPTVAVKMHVKEDYYRLPALLRSIAPDAKLYLRQRNYMSMMLVLYATFGRFGSDGGG